MERLATMLSLVSLGLVLVAGCSVRPCATSSQCGSGEVCAAARCAALSCDATWYATDPATGACTPMPACGNRDDVRGWTSCDNPCMGLSENDCIGDARCQPAYSSDSAGAGVELCGTGGVTPIATGGAPAGGAISSGSPPSCTQGNAKFVGCRPVPHAVDPCAGKDPASCAADSRCVEGTASCVCAGGGTSTGMGSTSSPPVGGVCNCPAMMTSCRVKGCGDFDQKDCAAHPECTTQPMPQPGPIAGSATQPAPAPRAVPLGCFDRGFGNCASFDEYTCLHHGECRPVGAPCFCPPNASCTCDGGKFLFCEPADHVRHCASDGDCHADERCSDSPECAPGFAASRGGCAGLCVPRGCHGDGESACNADQGCEPIYALQCLPYGNGGGVLVGCNQGGPGQGADPPSSCGGGCEPSFVACEPLGGGCDIGKSVLVRDPALLDDPFWSLPRVLIAVTGASDASAVADAWLTQLGTAVDVGGKSAAARQGAQLYLAAQPHRADGLLDVTRLGFVPTSLSNRLDLADPTSCGEARITYALAAGVTDRRHRMTIIVELRQPYDNVGCRNVAHSWLALSKLDGAELQAALQAIYTPLLSPANLKQIRTNEFLVGPANLAGSASSWELREWHLGSDQRLHQSLLPLAVDPTAAQSAEFVTWLGANAAALRKGMASFPTQYQVPTATEDGSRFNLPSQPALADLVNQQSCAGCHTTETTTAFAHVGERFGGSGRAQISQFLESELHKRAAHLGLVASGVANAVLDVRPAH